jgi:hypothetical protein
MQQENYFTFDGQILVMHTDSKPWNLLQAQLRISKSHGINAYGILPEGFFFFFPYSLSLFCPFLSLLFKGLKWVVFRVLQENY